MKLRPGWKRVKAGLYEKRQKGGLSAPWNERVLGLVVPEVYLVRKKSSTRWQMQEKETPRSRAHNIGTDTTASRAMARLDQRYKNDPPVRGFRREGSKIVPLSPPPKRRAPSRPRQTWGEWWRSLWSGQGQGRRVDEYQVVGEAKRRGIGDATIHGPFKTLKLARQFQRDVRDRGIQDGDGKQQHFITAPYMENNQYWVDIAYYFHTPEGTGVKYSARGRRAMSKAEKRALVAQAWEKQGAVSRPAEDLPPPIPGMEGPFRYRSGKILYYDPRKGQHYDRGSDMYVSVEDVEFAMSGRRAAHGQHWFVAMPHPTHKDVAYRWDGWATSEAEARKQARAAFRVSRLGRGTKVWTL